MGKIKNTKIVKRIIAPLPSWWKKVQLYAGITFAISSALAAIGSFLGLPVGVLVIIKLIMSISATLAGAAQFTKK